MGELTMLRGAQGVVMYQLARRGGVHLLRVFHRRLEPAVPWPMPPSYDIGVMTQDELLAECRDPALDLTETSVRAAYACGSLCIGARQRDGLVGYVWFAFDAAPHLDGIWVRVPARTIYRYKAFVRPAHRGKGIAPAMYRYAERVFSDRGREGVVDCIATHNFASIAASVRSGAHPLGHIGYWRSARRFLSFHSRAVRQLGLRFYVASAP
jgi:GNAT superfamily N-acetyltransferase